MAERVTIRSAPGPCERHGAQAAKTSRPSETVRIGASPSSAGASNGSAVVGHEVGVHAVPQRALLLLLMREARAPDRVQADRLEAGEPLGGVVVVLQGVARRGAGRGA